MNTLLENIKMGEKMVMCGAKGEIIETAINEAEQVVQDFYHKTDGLFKFPSPRRLWDMGEGWNVWMVEKGKYSGTWSKRYNSMVWQKFGCRPPEPMVAKLGDILSKFANCEQSHIVDITNVCDWTPGDFGESATSCWWHDYNRARLGLFRDGGMAMRFYNERKNGIGRCWIYPAKKSNMLYLFNAYHKKNLSLYNMACLLATHLGVSYKRCNLHASGAYINSEAGFCVAPVDVLDTHRTKLEDCVELNFVSSSQDDDEQTCTNCGRTYPAGDDWYAYNGEPICMRCYDNNYFTCNNCDNMFPIGEHYEAHGDYYCQDCFDEEFVACTNCGEAVRIDDATEYEGDAYCEDCAPVECNQCHEMTFKTYSGLCNECHAKQKESEK